MRRIVDVLLHINRDDKAIAFLQSTSLAYPVRRSPWNVCPIHVLSFFSWHNFWCSAVLHYFELDETEGVMSVRVADNVCDNRTAI
jgi:hypothetical protein